MAKNIDIPVTSKEQVVADQPVPEKPVEIKTRNVIISTDSGKYILNRHRIPRAKFLNFYNIPKMWKRYLIVICVGIFASFELIFFVKSPGNYSSGVSAFTQGIAGLAYTLMDKFGYSRGHMSWNTVWVVYNVLYWSLYFIMNIPLFILGYKAIGKTFTKLTIVYIGTAMVVGLIISSTIPSIQNILLLGNTIPMGDAPDLSNVVESHNIFAKQGVNAVPFWYPIKQDAIGINIYDVGEDPERALSLFLYAFVHGVLMSIICAILYIVGASTGGTDFISFWYSNKGKELGKTLLMISIITTFIGCTIGTWIPAGIVDHHGWGYQFLFSANLVASFFAAFISIMFLRMFYPTNRIVKLEIFTSHADAVIKRMLDIQYAHSATLNNSQDVRYKKAASTIVTYCLFNEVPRVIEEVQVADKGAFITAIPVTGVHGFFNEYRQGDAIKPKVDPVPPTL